VVIEGADSRKCGTKTAAEMRVFVTSHQPNYCFSNAQENDKLMQTIKTAQNNLPKVQPARTKNAARKSGGVFVSRQKKAS